MARDALQNHNPRFSSVASPTDENFSQSTVRMYAIFTDQFGREWGADVERKTMHPCGPLQPKFHAPMLPPREFIRVTDTLRRRVFVDLDAWLRHLQMRHTDYADMAMREAQRLFTDQYHTVLERLNDGRILTKNPALLQRIGGPPEPFEIVQAMKAKNRWILGLKNPDGSTPRRPKHPLVDEWFPEKVEVKVRDPFTGDVVEDPFSVDSGETEPEGEDPLANDFEPHPKYPFMFRPGHWDLSEALHRARLAGMAEAFAGNGEQALEELERIRELHAAHTETVAETEPAGAGVHESWG